MKTPSGVPLPLNASRSRAEDSCCFHMEPRRGAHLSASTFPFPSPKFSLDTLYVSTAKHVFEKKLKPKLMKLPQAKSSPLINKEIYRITQTIESYLLSIVNPEWAVAIAISLAQDIPEGTSLPPTAAPWAAGSLCWARSARFCGFKGKRRDSSERRMPPLLACLTAER